MVATLKSNLNAGTNLNDGTNLEVNTSFEANNVITVTPPPIKLL